MNCFFDSDNSFNDNENKNPAEGEPSFAEKQEEGGRSGMPYGNQSPYGGYPYSVPPYKIKPSLMQRITAFFTEDKVLPLSMASIAAAAAIILFRIAGDIFRAIVASDKALYELYRNNQLYEAVFGMAYTVLGIGLPFLLAYLFLKRTGGITLPLDRPAKKSGAGYLVLAGLGICYVGNVAVAVLMSMLSSAGIDSYSYTAALDRGVPLPENAFQLLCTVMYVAVFPAFFEEFAFRGVIMQPLRKYGDRFAIVVSAVLFGLVHGNITQVPFACIAGVALGYASIVTGSMWTGIVIHFFNNFLSLVYSWARQGLSTSASLIFSTIFIYGIIFAGIVSLAGYAWQNPDMLRLYPSTVRPKKKGHFTAVYFLMPAMLVAILLLFRKILSDVILRG